MLSDNIELGGLWGVGDMLGCLCVDVSFLANDRACNDVRRRLKMCLEFFGTCITTSTVSVLVIIKYRKI